MMWVDMPYYIGVECEKWVLAWDNLLRRIGVRRRWLDSWTSILKKNCGVPKSEDIPRATHSPKGDEAHPRHNIAGES
jgi:hypothetical protein